MGLKKRIIPCLDIRNGRTVKGIRFEQLRDIGDPVEMAAFYASEGADELVFLDIAATGERRKPLADLVTGIAREIDIPLTAGGGIRSDEDAYQLLCAGADKIAVNTAAISDPGLLTRLAKRFGSQCIVLAMDIKLQGGRWAVYGNAGGVASMLEAKEWALAGADYGAGELLITTIGQDGTGGGYSTGILKEITNASIIPVIASGGAGNMEDFLEVFEAANVDAALAASVFHEQQIRIPQLKAFLKERKIPVRI